MVVWSWRSEVKDSRKASQQFRDQPLEHTRLDELFLQCDEADFYYLEPTEFDSIPARGDTDTDVEDEKPSTSQGTAETPGHAPPKDEDSDEDTLHL